MSEHCVTGVYLRPVTPLCYTKEHLSMKKDSLMPKSEVLASTKIHTREAAENLKAALENDIVNGLVPLTRATEVVIATSSALSGEILVGSISSKDARAILRVMGQLAKFAEGRA